MDIKNVSIFSNLRNVEGSKNYMLLRIDPESRIVQYVLGYLRTFFIVLSFSLLVKSLLKLFQTKSVTFISYLLMSLKSIWLGDLNAMFTLGTCL